MENEKNNMKLDDAQRVRVLSPAVDGCKAVFPQQTGNCRTGYHYLYVPVCLCRRCSQSVFPE